MGWKEDPVPARDALELDGARLAEAELARRPEKFVHERGTRRPHRRRLVRDPRA
jgi:hypothetical protein